MKKWTAVLLTLAMLLCSISAMADYTAGTYSATVPGASGDVTVETTVDETGAILKVEVVKQTETSSDIARVLTDVPASIVEAQSTEVDAVSGSTITSKAIFKAVEMALAQARGEEIAGEAKADHVVCTRTDHPVAAGTMLSVRGQGRVRLVSLDGTTRKDRIGITLFRFE